MVLTEVSVQLSDMKSANYTSWCTCLYVCVHEKEHFCVRENDTKRHQKSDVRYMNYIFKKL